MDKMTREWLKLLESRVRALERDDELDDAEDEHADNMRWSIIIGALCALELLTAIYAVYVTVHHG